MYWRGYLIEKALQNRMHKKEQGLDKENVRANLAKAKDAKSGV
jgi:hypothetical protein